MQECVVLPVKKFKGCKQCILTIMTDQYPFGNGVDEGENTLICFTDGSCTNNGSKVAKASYAVVWPSHSELNTVQEIEDGPRTNNRAEMKAFILACNQANCIDPDKNKILIVYTDSMLLYNTVTTWMSTWKKKGWKKADNSPVANLDLVKEIDNHVEKRVINMRHVKAHTGKKDWASTFNDMVDKLATSKTK